MKKGRVKKKKIGLVEWILIGLVILAVLFLAFKILITGNVINPPNCISDSVIQKGNIFILETYSIKYRTADSILSNNLITSPVIIFDITAPGSTSSYYQAIGLRGTGSFSLGFGGKTFNFINTSSADVSNFNIARKCSSSTDCCSGLTCQSGICKVPIVAPKTNVPASIPACLSKGKTCSSTTAKCCSNSCRQTMFFGRKWGSPHCR